MLLFFFIPKKTYEFLVGCSLTYAIRLKVHRFRATWVKMHLARRCIEGKPNQIFHIYHKLLVFAPSPKVRRNDLHGTFHIYCIPIIQACIRKNQSRFRLTSYSFKNLPVRRRKFNILATKSYHAGRHTATIGT